MSHSQSPPSHQKRSASADLPSISRASAAAAAAVSAVASSSAVPPKKRARNQPEHQLDEDINLEASEAAEAATGVAPLDLTAPGRGRSRCDDAADEVQQQQQQQLSGDATSTSSSAAAAAAAYMSRCAEALRTMGGLAAPEDHSADAWLAMGHWQASLHAQYLYYSSLALSGFLPTPPSSQPPTTQAHPALSSKVPPPSSLLSPGFGGLFAPPPPPPLPPMLPPPSLPPFTPPTQLHQLQSSPPQRHALEDVRHNSPMRQPPTPQSPQAQTGHSQMQSQQQQHQQQQQQHRRIKANRIAPPASPVPPTSHSISKSSPASMSSAAAQQSQASSQPERQTSGETDFQCSCGRAFASLIGLTLHLKETGHGPGATLSRDRDIPKLVRGQDMWINSETEQTREILRCIRCKQSYRTLPELTMHMIKTRHYTEIIYTDAASQPPSQQQQLQQSGSSSSSSKLSHVAGLLTAKEASAATTSAAAAAAARAGVVGAKDRQAGTSHHRSGRTEVKEADSATDPQQQQQQQASGATSTLQKMQHFVEASLPRSALRRSAMFQEVLQNSVFDAATSERFATDTDNEDDEQQLLREGRGAECRHGGATACGDQASYLSPDRPPEPKENPLSSLQKLVDTTDKTSAAAAAATSAAAVVAAAAVAASAAASSLSSAPARSSSGATRDGTPTEAGSSCSVNASSAAAATAASAANRHTVIMLSPTYIYQGGLYPPFPVCHPSTLLSTGGAGGNGGGLSSGGSSGGGPIDLSKLPHVKQRADEIASTPKKSLIGATSATTAASIGALPLTSSEASEKQGANCGNGGWPESLMQKKAKCHYCSKPFANKGQVRLHVSKGKCPSLLARLPTAALPPFPFFPTIDYIKAAGRFHAATAPSAASGKELQA